MISVLFGYRDRDPERLQACLLSLAAQVAAPAFEVVVVDFGSSEPYKTEVENLVVHFNGLVKYYYAPLQDQFWNRSQALNLAAAKATGSWLVFGDIDLIYAPNFLQYIAGHCQVGTKYNYRCRYLPEGVLETNYTVLAQTQQAAPLSADSGLGLSVLATEDFAKTGGYDERFMIWGVEDVALQYRAEHAGLAHAWINPDALVTYHIWHPIDPNLFVHKLYPTLWGLYHQTRHLPAAHYTSWALLQHKQGWPQTPHTDFTLNSNTVSGLMLAQDLLLQQLPGHILKISVAKQALKANSLVQLANTWLQKLTIGYRLEHSTYATNAEEKPEKAHIALVLFLLINRGLCQDYSWQETKTTFILLLKSR